MCELLEPGNDGFAYRAQDKDWILNPTALRKGRTVYYEKRTEKIIKFYCQIAQYVTPKAKNYFFNKKTVEIDYSIIREILITNIKSYKKAIYKGAEKNDYVECFIECNFKNDCALSFFRDIVTDQENTENVKKLMVTFSIFQHYAKDYGDGIAYNTTSPLLDFTLNCDSILQHITSKDDFYIFMLDYNKFIEYSKQLYKKVIIKDGSLINIGIVRKDDVNLFNKRMKEQDGILLLTPIMFTNLSPIGQQNNCLHTIAVPFDLFFINLIKVYHIINGSKQEITAEYFNKNYADDLQEHFRKEFAISQDVSGKKLVPGTGEGGREI